MMLLEQVHDTAFLIVITFGITLLSWRLLFLEADDEVSQVALAVYILAAMIFFLTGLILIWIP